MEVFSRDLTLPQLRQLHRRMRAEVGVERAKPLTRKHQALLEVVQRRKREGVGKAKQTAKSFWQGVQQEWNDAHPNEQYQTWRGLEVLWRRIDKKRGKGGDVR